MALLHLYDLKAIRMLLSLSNAYVQFILWTAKEELQVENTIKFLQAMIQNHSLML